VILLISVYCRYVDDIFMIAPIDIVPHIIDTFNSQHDRIKFTVEFEKENHCLNFLDTSIINKNNKIIIDWYKKIFSDRYLSFFFNPSYLS